jgi:Xaa-Pro aminopeptidase
VPYKEALPFTVAEYQERIAKVRTGMGARGLDAILVTAPENIYYLSNHQTPAHDAFQALLLPLEGEPTLIAQRAEELIARGYSWVERVTTYQHGEPPLEVTRSTLEAAGFERGRVGVEKNSLFLSVQTYEGLQSMLPHATFPEGSGIIERLRAVKSEQELVYIRQAARVAEIGMRAGLEAAEPGRHDVGFRRGGARRHVPGRWRVHVVSALHRGRATEQCGAQHVGRKALGGR